MNIIVLVIVVLLAMNIARKILMFRQQRKATQVRTSRLTTTDEQFVADTPVSFGYKCMWFAVKTNDTNRVAEIIQLKQTSSCNWKTGIEKAYDYDVFITPPVDGWTLVCGWGIIYVDEKETEQTIKQNLQRLSHTFGEAQFFYTHRVTEYHWWVRAINGNITREYGYFGERGENTAVFGDPTEFERSLPLVNTFSEEAKDPAYAERTDLVVPDEGMVMDVAESWSINPMRLDERGELGLGIVGRL